MLNTGLVVLKAAPAVNLWCYGITRRTLAAASIEKRQRFDSMVRLYGQRGAQRIFDANVCVIGIGGVGSWVAEGLARAGVGRITLIDLDEVCISNIPRQLMALNKTVGQPKVDVMKERILAINPECSVKAVQDFAMPNNLDQVITEKFDYVVDAVDRVSHKVSLIHHCVLLRIPIIVCGGSAGIDNPYSLTVDDLSKVVHNRLLASVRTKLRREFKYPSGGGKAKKWNIPAVFMRENTNISARALGGEAGDDGVEQSVNSGGRGSNCSAGAAGFVTGSMGLFAVSHIVNEIVTLGSGKVGKLPPTILLDVESSMEKRSISSLSSPQPESLSKPDESAEMPNISSQECTSTISNLEIGGGAFTGESTDVQSGIGSCGGDGDGTVESAVEDARASASNQNVCFRLFDAHCHFHLDEGSREALPGLGLSGVALMATEPPDWEAVTELQASVQTGGEHDIEFKYAYGVHPWFAHRHYTHSHLQNKVAIEELPWFRELERRLTTTDAIVGEIGLDKIAKTPETDACEYQLQCPVFEAQLQLAARLQLPVCCHCVRAYGDMYNQFRALAAESLDRLPPRVYMHSYGGSPDTLIGLLRLPNGAGRRFYFGFSFFVNSRNRDKTLRCIQKVPDDRLLLESDLSSPGQAYTALSGMVDLIAQAKGWSWEEAATICERNAREFYAPVS